MSASYRKHTERRMYTYIYIYIFMYTLTEIISSGLFVARAAAPSLLLLLLLGFAATTMANSNGYDNDEDNNDKWTLARKTVRKCEWCTRSVRSGSIIVCTMYKYLIILVIIRYNTVVMITIMVGWAAHGRPVVGVARRCRCRCRDTTDNSGASRPTTNVTTRGATPSLGFTHPYGIVLFNSNAMRERWMRFGTKVPKGL